MVLFKYLNLNIFQLDFRGKIGPHDPCLLIEATTEDSCMKSFPDDRGELYEIIP